MTTAQGQSDMSVYERHLPPVDRIATATIAVAVAGGVYLASYLPRRAPLGPAFALLGVGALLVCWNAFTLRRIGDFAWDVFFLVARWALVAYLVVAGMLEYVFILDHTRDGLLLVLTLMLALFAVNVPMLLAFSVARYQPPNGGGR
jgi:hypothetical protein